MSEWKIETFANPAEETAIYTGEAGSYVNIGSVMGKDTAQRVVDCVNALADVEDPAAFMEAARDWVNALAPGAPPLSPPAALGHWASVRSHLID